MGAGAASLEEGARRLRERTGELAVKVKILEEAWAGKEGLGMEAVLGEGMAVLGVEVASPGWRSCTSSKQSDVNMCCACS